VLAGLEMTADEFIDLCILLGCDYCDSIRGIGPKKAVALIEEHKDIETILENIDTAKYPPPENWPYKEARRLFVEPEVEDGASIELKFGEPDLEGLIEYLCKEKNFSEDRVRSGHKKLMAAKKTGKQGRLDSFFKVLPSSNVKTPPAKRKPEKGKKGNPSKRGKK